MNIQWAFVLGGAVILVNSIVALVDFLQGGVAWPCLALVIGWQVWAVWQAPM